MGIPFIVHNMITKLIRFLAALAACCVVTGCATVNPMAFDKQTKAIDTKDKSIVLMTVVVSRPDRSRFEPVPYVVHIEKPDAQSKEDRQNFKIDKDADSLHANGQDLYLLRLALVAGEYKLIDIFGMARAFPINGMFSVPLLAKLNVKPNSVTYIGRVTAKLRHRVGGEFRAGPVIPLLDQAIAGMSGSTWDIAIDNLADQDIGLFKTTYPVLNNVTIETAALAPFDRAAAQHWWDGESTPADKSAEPAMASVPASVAAPAPAQQAAPR
ncbi:hypothetical protein [Massilia rhizosphaerae]|uniref:hypothetical protein n=1 Tax=Massilia rhizosphaerae TaxID=2784389 RepID=UPI0018DDF64A|nr:hypothetical protein [Massilia rhizosphaerae]